MFNRDLIDLVMIQPSRNMFRAAVEKAEQPYGHAIINDLARAIEKCQQRDWLEQCMRAMEIDIPKALLWKHIRALQRMMPK